MLRNLLVRSFSANLGDVGGEGWERRLESHDGKLLGRKGEGGFGSHLGRCPFRLTFPPLRAPRSPQAVLDSCGERRSLAGDGRLCVPRLGPLVATPGLEGPGGKFLIPGSLGKLYPVILKGLSISGCWFYGCQKAV